MSNAPLVFSHLKSFSFGLENDIQGIKRALELRSTNGFNRNSIEEDELFLKDLHNNALSTQIKYTQIEDSVFGPIENRLSYVTVEEMNERFQELLESNNKIIQSMMMQNRRAADTTLDYPAQTQAQAPSTANFDNSSKNNACDSMNCLEKSIDSGDQSVDDNHSHYDNRSELQSSFNDHMNNNFSNTSMEENKDGEFPNTTPNKTDIDKASDLTPESPDISPTFKIKFQSSYTNNANKIVGGNNLTSIGIRFSELSGSIGNMADNGCLTPETPNATDLFRSSIQRNSDLLCTPPTPDTTLTDLRNVKTVRINRTTDKRRASDQNPIVPGIDRNSDYNGSSNRDLGEITEDKSPVHKVINITNSVNSSKAVIADRCSTDYTMNILASSGNIGDDDDLNDINSGDYSQFKVAKLLQPRNVTAKDGWIPSCTQAEVDSLPPFLKQQITLNTLNTGLELLNCHVTSSLSSFMQDDLCSILKASFPDNDRQNAIKMAMVYLKKLDIVTEAGVKRYKVKKYY